MKMRGLKNGSNVQEFLVILTKVPNIYMEKLNFLLLLIKWPSVSVNLAHVL